jgi:MFS family permease
VTLLARLMLVPLAMVPMLADRNLALDLLLVCLAVVTPLGAIGGCAWMSWTSDLVPHARLGHVFGRRQLWATLAGIVAGLAGAGLVDGWTRVWPGWRMGGYVGVFTLAIVAAMASTWFLTRMPDIKMAPRESGHLGMLFAKPFRDANFRRVMIFLGSWTFAVNLAMPFFTVYLVQDLGCGLTVPVLLTVVGQVANILALPWWGRVSDRLSNKRVIAIAAPMLLAAILCWVVAAEPAPHALTLPLIFVAEVVLGAASAGLDLAGGNIALKTAPRGAATVYLGTNGLFKSVCGGIAPVAGGYLAQALAGMPGTIVLPWLGHAITGLSVRPLMVVFVASCIIGLLALTRLHRISEAGDPAEPAPEPQAKRREAAA